MTTEVTKHFERHPSQNITASSILFPVYGVTLKFFQEFIDTVCGGEANILEKTTKDICEEFIKPHTEDFQRSYCDVLVRQEHIEVGVADIFISHAWSCRFLDVYDALRHHFRDRTTSLYLWFDLFSNNQHSTLDRDFDWWCSTFKGAIGAMQHVVMVLAPWHDPVPLTRSWCLFELYCSAETECVFEIAMSRKERAMFVESMVQDVEGCLLSVLHRVRCERSEAFDKNDQKRIFEAVERTVGFTQINTMVFEQLRKWFIHALEESLTSETMILPDSPTQLSRSKSLYESFMSSSSTMATRETSLSSTGLSKLALSPQVSTSKLLAALDTSDSTSVFPAPFCSFTAATGSSGGALEESTTSTVLEDKHEDFGDDEKYWSRLSALAQVFVMQGASTKAHMVLEPLYRRLQHKLGHHHPQTLAVGRDLAMVQQKYGNYSDAQRQYLLDYDQRRKLYGADHPDTLIAMNFVANTANHLGQYSEAEALHRSCLATRQLILGDAHLDTFWSQNNLALSLRDRAMLEKTNVFQQLSLCIQGNAPINTDKQDYRELKYVERRINWLKEAISLLRQCHTGRAAQLGQEQTLTLGALHNLANNLRDLASILVLKKIMWKNICVEKGPQGAFKDNGAEIFSLQDEANTLYSTCITKWTMMLGKDHSLSLLARLNASILQYLQVQQQELSKQETREKCMDTLDEVIATQRQVAQEMSQSLGEKHPFSLQGVQHLMISLLSKSLILLPLEILELNEEIVQLIQFVILSRQEVLGADHPASLMIVQLFEDWQSYKLLDHSLHEKSQNNSDIDELNLMFAQQGLADSSLNIE